MNPRIAVAAGCALGTGVVLVALRGIAPYPVLGLADPGLAVRLATPVLRLLADLTAAGCVGGLVLTLVLDDAPDPRPGVLAWSSVAAWGWSVAALAAGVAALADTTGGRLPGADVVVVMLARAEPAGWLATAVVAALVAVWVREARTWTSAAGAGLLAAVGLLGPVVTGHAVDGVGHDLAGVAAGFRVLALTVWLGSTAAVVLAGASPSTRRRQERLVVLAATVLVVAGGMEGALLVGSPAGVGSAYGVLAVAAGALAILAAVVRRHPGVVLAALGILAGLAAVAARAVPPVQEPGHATAAQAVLGYGLPDPPTLTTLLTAWRPDLVYAPLAALLAVGYGVGLRRWRRAGGRWPPGRSVAWFAGCAVLLVATSSGLGRYGPAVFSVHVTGHMLTSLVVPALWVLGAPVTLAREVLRPAALPARRLEQALAAPTLRVATHPALITVAVVGSPFLLYLTPVFSLTQPIGWLQPLMTAWFLTAGVLFWWLLVGIDPAPRRLPPVARLTILVATMPFHAVFAAVLLAAPRPVSGTPALLTDGGGGQVFVDDFYQRLALPWAPDALADQHLAAALTWAMGDLPLLLMVGVLLVQWSREAARDDAVARVELAGR